MFAGWVLRPSSERISVNDTWPCTIGLTAVSVCLTLARYVLLMRPSCHPLDWTHSMVVLQSVWWKTGRNAHVMSGICNTLLGLCANFWVDHRIYFIQWPTPCHLSHTVTHMYTSSSFVKAFPWGSYFCALCRRIHTSWSLQLQRHQLHTPQQVLYLLRECCGCSCSREHKYDCLRLCQGCGVPVWFDLIWIYHWMMGCMTAKHSRYVQPGRISPVKERLQRGSVWCGQYICIKSLLWFNLFDNSVVVVWCVDAYFDSNSWFLCWVLWLSKSRWF